MASESCIDPPAPKSFPAFPPGITEGGRSLIFITPWATIGLELLLKEITSGVGASGVPEVGKVRPDSGVRSGLSERPRLHPISAGTPTWRLASNP